MEGYSTDDELECKDITIAACIMAKNEEERIHVTILSVINHVDCIIFLDTGSEDRTIEIVTELCNKYNKKLYLKETTFTNFSITKIWLSLIENNQLHGFESKLKFYHMTNLEIFRKLQDL